jgi:hypothetical protein
MMIQINHFCLSRFSPSLCAQLPTQNPTHDWIEIWWEIDQEQCWMQWMTLLWSADHKVFQLEYRNVSFKEVHLRRCAVQLTFLEARVQYWSSNWHFLSQELILEFTPFTRARLCRLLSNWALAQASKYLFLVTAYLLTAVANIPPFVQLFFLITLKLSGCREDNIPLPQPNDTKVTSSQLCHHDNEYSLLLGFYFEDYSFNSTSRIHREWYFSYGFPALGFWSHMIIILPDPFDMSCVQCPPSTWVFIGHSHSRFNPTRLALPYYQPLGLRGLWL